MKNYITYADLYLEIPLSVLKILKIEIEEELNEHGIAKLEILVDAQKETDIINCLTSATDIKIIAKIQKKKKYLFVGIPVFISLKHCNEIYKISLKLKSKSFLLDMERKTRSFQNPNNSYVQLFKNIIKDNKATVFENVSKGALQEKPVIQYEETDWEFLKRIASTLNAKVITNVIGENPTFWIGVQQGMEYQVDISSYKILQDLDWNSKHAFKEGKKNLSQNLRYQFGSFTNYLLYDKIIYKNITYTIIKKRCNLKNGIFIYTYDLIRGKKVQQEIITNNKMIGASIEGKVIAVSGSKVKLHLSVDKEQDVREAYWYPYQIPYSSGKSGMYIMPVKEDYVELYFPKGKAEEGYVRYCKRSILEKNQSPSHKYLSDATGKGIFLCPDKIQIISEKAPFLLKMTDKNGIEITGNSNVHIQTTKTASVTGNKVALYAKEEIVLVTDSGSICVGEEIQMKAKGKVQI